MRRDYLDLLGGGLLVVLGLAVALYATVHYDVGSLRRMGPGAFPAGAGCILALLGVIIALPALFRTGTAAVVEFRAALGVIGAICVFALVVRPFGMVAAIVAMTFTAALARRDPHWVESALLAVVLALIAYAVFRLGLGIHLPMLRWPG